MKTLFRAVPGLLAAVLLASCAGAGEPPALPAAEPSNSAAAPQAQAQPVKGLSLEDAGYSIDYAAAPPELQERLERESGFQSVTYDDNWVDGIKGNYTKLFVYMNYLYGSDEVILSYHTVTPNPTLQYAAKKGTITSKASGTSSIVTAVGTFTLKQNAHMSKTASVTVKCDKNGNVS